MKRWRLALGWVLLMALWGCGERVPASAAPAETARQQTWDQGDPVAVVEAVFAVAAGKLPAETLTQLCHPEEKNDIDTRRICDFGAGFEPGGEFVMFFQKGKVTAPATVRGNTAAVPFAFGPNGDDQEVMTLVRRDGKWYLLSF